MFDSLDIMISIGVVFLILSMVLKYLMSMVKRFFKIKANVIAREMETFIGENTSKYLISYLEKNAKYLNFLENIKGGKGLRQLNKEQLKEIIKELNEFLENKSDEEIEQKLEVKENIQEVKEHLKTLSNKIMYMYDNTMDKISEVYETKLRWRTFYFGLLLVFCIDADFFDIYHSISKNSTVREQLVAQSEIMRAQWESTARELDKLNAEEITGKVKEEIENTKNYIESKMSNLEKTGLSLGWTKNTYKEAMKGPGSIIHKLIGLLVSALLISFGAPFWHDFIGSFTGIRRTLMGKRNGKGGTQSILSEGKTTDEEGK